MMSNKEETICAATTIRAPLHEVKAFVNYSLNIGIDHVFLFYDSPGDFNFTMPIVHPKVTCILCDDNYWEKTGKKKEELSVEERQRFNANLIFKYAKNKYKWFIHLDGDEL
ncbi:MAG: glycosyltransferase family 2 protein, partial [Promethearchaeota archaeon]